MSEATGGLIGSGGADVGVVPGTGGALMVGTGGEATGSGGVAPGGTGGSGVGELQVPADYPRGMSPGCGKDPQGHSNGGEYGSTYTWDTTPNQAWIDEFSGNDQQKGLGEYMQRKYRVRTPSGYDKNKPYTVNIVHGGCGGTSESWGGLSAWPREDESDVIHVHPAMKDGCYKDDGVGNPEVAFMNVWWDEFINNFCVDLERVFMSGWSSGSWESQTIACEFPGTIRGIGTATGGLRERRNECGGPIATIKGADASDRENPVHDTVEASSCTGTESEGCWMGKTICTGSYATRNDYPSTDPRNCVDEGSALGRDLMLEMNGCVGTETVPWGGTIDDVPVEQGGIYRYPTFTKNGNQELKPGEPVPQSSIDAVKDYFDVPLDGKNNVPACHKYVGCPAEFPVVWCMTYDDGHSPVSRISERKGDDGRTGYQRFFEDEVPYYPVN